MAPDAVLVQHTAKSKFPCPFLGDAIWFAVGTKNLKLESKFPALVKIMR